MNLYDLTGTFISDTYERLVQIGTSGLFYDGLGNQLIIDGTGTSGTSGTSGIGIDGTSGTSGFGIDGTSGTSGINGTSGTSFTNVMTTLGDIIYESSTSPTRLPGNTSNTTKFLSQQGTGTSSAAPQWSSLTGTLGITIDGSGGVISTGSKGFLFVPYVITITGWFINANTSGSIVVDVQTCPYASFPTTTSIAGTDLPTLSSVQVNSDTSLTNWGTLTISANSYIQFIVNSASTVSRVNLFLTYTKN